MYEELLGHIDRLMEQRPMSKKALASYRELAVLMRDAQPKPKAVLLDIELKDIKMQEGFPLFSRQDLPLDFDTPRAILGVFLGYLCETDREDQAGLKKAKEKWDLVSDWSLELFKALLGEESEALSKIAEEVDLHPKTLVFLAQLALKPSLQALRESIGDRLEKEGWKNGYCPVCGSQPNMSYFDKKGGRCLHCQLCGEDWLFQRLQCPFCQNQEHKTQGYFEAEQEEGLRVDFCRKCQRYLKVIDMRAFEKVAPMDLEDLATMHLDILADEQGLKG